MGYFCIKIVYITYYLKLDVALFYSTEYVSVYKCIIKRITA